MTDTTDTTAVIVPETSSVAMRAMVSTKEFVKELEWAARFTGKKSTLPILQNVALRSAHGALSITGSDLETAGETSVTAAGDFFAVTIPAAQALKYLKRVTETELVIVSQGTAVTFRHGDGMEATIDGLPIEQFPETPVAPSDTVFLDGLREALPRALVAVSSEESRFTLNGALLEIKASGASIVGTDGHRLSLANIWANSKVPLKALVGLFAWKEVARWGEDSLRFAANEQFAFFVSGKRKIIARKLDGNFPDYERVIPQDLPHTATIDTARLHKHGERVAVFADERSHAMSFRLYDNELTISTGTTGAGKATAKIASSWMAEANSDVWAWNSGFNWEYVADFLKLAPKTAFDLKFAFATRKDGVTEREGENVQASIFTVPGWLYLVMPMRM